MELDQKIVLSEKELKNAQVLETQTRNVRDVILKRYNESLKNDSFLKKPETLTLRDELERVEEDYSRASGRVYSLEYKVASVRETAEKKRKALLPLAA